MSEFLLEIMTEELPASHVRTGLDQLKEALDAELAAAGLLQGQEVKVMGTCRRLVALAEIAPRQRDRQERVIGPPKAAAFKPDGTPTPAALGFAKSRGVDISQLTVFETERGEYVGFLRTEAGGQSSCLLPDMLKRVIGGLTFPKMMRWADNPFRFSRPIKNLLGLVDGQPLDFEVAGLRSVAFTFGHKIFHPDLKIRPQNFGSYRASLREALVVVEPEVRREMIRAEIQKLLEPLGAQLHPDEELLEKLVYDVEHPHVFLGSFHPEFLKLPLEVLSTALREGQHLFSVVKAGRQQPLFMGVADARGDSKGLIRQGNERVLKARLKDADFFWQQDIKVPLTERAKGLERVIFQEKLGTYQDKAQRLRKLAVYLSDKADAAGLKKEALLAAELCKADLLTDMVREFSSLQGQMGGLLAREQGLPKAAGQAIYEHYKPVGLEDESPASSLGAILSLVDKVDSITGVLGLGIETTGSSDPFGLRRNAHGVCKIILDKKFNFSFGRLLDKTLEIYGQKLERPAAEVKSAALEFFVGRLRYIYERQGFRYDLVNAALGPGIDNIHHSFLRLKALSALRSSPQFEPFILMAKRVNNILRDQPACRMNQELFSEKEEKELWSVFSIIRENAAPMMAKGDYAQAQQIVFRLQPALNTFFDRVLVMAEEKRLRQNRLGLLQAISRLLSQIADYGQVVLEGEKAQ
jgi:glycyl-tRNA synthetase beta chain